MFTWVFVGSQISGFPGPQSSRFPEIWPGPGLARVGPGLGQRVVLAGVGNCSPAAPRQPRRTNLRRSKELGQDRENPISASPVWGITAFAEYCIGVSAASWRLGLSHVHSDGLVSLLRSISLLWYVARLIHNNICNFPGLGALQ